MNTIPENIIRLLPQCHDWVLEYTQHFGSFALKSGSYPGYNFSKCDGFLCRKMSGGPGIIETIISNSVDARELIFRAWKEGGKICENLMATGLNEGPCHGQVNVCYEGAFGARLLSQVCSAPSEMLHSFFQKQKIESSNYLPFLAGAIAGIAATVLIYKAVKYFHANHHVPLAPNALQTPT